MLMSNQIQNSEQKEIKPQCSELGIGHHAFMHWRSEKTEENANKLKEAMLPLGRKKRIPDLAARPYVKESEIKELLKTEAFKPHYLKKRENQRRQLLES